MLNESIQKVLLTKSDLTLKQAVSTSQGMVMMEAATMKWMELHGKGGQRSASSVMAVNAPAGTL